MTMLAVTYDQACMDSGQDMTSIEVGREFKGVEHNKSKQTAIQLLGLIESSGDDRYRLSTAFREASDNNSMTLINGDKLSQIHEQGFPIPILLTNLLNGRSTPSRVQGDVSCLIDTLTRTSDVKQVRELIPAESARSCMLSH